MTQDFTVHKSIVSNAVNAQPADLGKNVATLISTKISEKIDDIRASVNNQVFGVNEEVELKEYSGSRNTAASLGFKHGSSGQKNQNPHPASSDHHDAYNDGYKFGKRKKETKDLGIDESTDAEYKALEESYIGIHKAYANGFAHGQDGKPNQNPHDKRQNPKSHKAYESGHLMGKASQGEKVRKVDEALQEGPSYGMRTSAHNKLMAALDAAKKKREAAAAAVKAHQDAAKK